MSWSGKMDALKKAAKDLVATLKKASSSPGDVRIAIIPFDTTVNIGTAYKNEPWFDYDNLDCNGWKKGNGICTKWNWKTYWEGCVRDRKYPYDTRDDAPGSKNGTLFPVWECDNLVSMMPLSSDWTALNNKIESMTPNGYTNVTIGLVWGFHALTKSAPLAEAVTPSSDLDKVIILLTDGENTESWNEASGKVEKNSTHIDARTKLTCDEVKAANIKIYTIRVIEGNADLLTKCASTPSMYYDVQQASQLSGVFSKIAENLANLRIAK
jgi:hypothetical protein